MGVCVILSILILLPMTVLSKDKKFSVPDNKKFSFTIIDSNEDVHVVLKYQGSNYEIVFNLNESDMLVIQGVIPKLKEQEAYYKKEGCKKKVIFGETIQVLKDDVSNNLLKFSASCANNRINSTVYIGSQDPNKAYYYKYQDSITITAKKLDKVIKKVMKSIKK